MGYSSRSRSRSHERSSYPSDKSHKHRSGHKSHHRDSSPSERDRNSHRRSRGGGYLHRHSRSRSRSPQERSERKFQPIGDGYQKPENDSRNSYRFVSFGL